MLESGHHTPEHDPKASDAAWLAKLWYYSADRQHKIDEPEIGEIVADIESYCRFRAKQDPEMGRAIVEAFESFRDPDPTLALHETAEDMRREAASLREALGLPPADTPAVQPPQGG